jgi:hypothetical protein
MSEDKLKIIYKHNRPYGIRNEDGFILFFPTVTKYEGQEERYKEEILEQFALATYLFMALKRRG